MVSERASKINTQYLRVPAGISPRQYCLIITSATRRVNAGTDHLLTGSNNYYSYQATIKRNIPHVMPIIFWHLDFKKPSIWQSWLHPAEQKCDNTLQACAERPPTLMARPYTSGKGKHIDKLVRKFKPSAFYIAAEGYEECLTTVAKNP